MGKRLARSDEGAMKIDRIALYADELTAELRADGYEVISGPRMTGDGYYESCVVAIEDNQIEIIV